MKSLKTFILLLGLIVLSSFSFAGSPPPSLKDVKVLATVGYDKSSDIYTYTYEVYNPPLNNEPIVFFQIDIAKPLDTQELDSENLVIIQGINVQGNMLIRSFEEEIGRIGILLEKPIIPVGAQPPSGHSFPDWTADITVMGTVMWGGSERNLILPGQTQGGFVLTSYGLPGIRDTIVEPDYVVDMEDVPGEVFEEDRLKEYIEGIEESIAYKGKTLGPTAPPADFKPFEFLDYIISMKHEAFQLGWIRNAGIENSLDKKLDSARKSLEKGSTTSAKNVLSAFVNEVEAQGCESYENCPAGKHLTPEAWALLKYNVEYLLDRL